jgi:zinc transporter 5/7
MFIELFYGLYSNSLGLVSDAGHMLFDCAALAIGLYASYVSNVAADSVYSYGYVASFLLFFCCFVPGLFFFAFRFSSRSRFKVISGFVNGVLLFYIAFFVFVEAIEVKT